MSKPASPRVSAFAVGKAWRNPEAGLFADRHELQPLGPSGNDLRQPERRGVSAGRSSCRTACRPRSSRSTRPPLCPLSSAACRPTPVARPGRRGRTSSWSHRAGATPHRAVHLLLGNRHHLHIENEWDSADLAHGLVGKGGERDRGPRTVASPPATISLSPSLSPFIVSLRCPTMGSPRVVLGRVCPPAVQPFMEFG